MKKKRGKEKIRKVNVRIVPLVYKSILADCQLRQVDVYSRFIVGLIRGRPGLTARAEILPVARHSARSTSTVTDCITSLSSPLR